MHTDARLTLYGAVGSGAAVLAVGLYCGCPGVQQLGPGLTLGGLLVALGIETLADPPTDINT